MAKILAEGEEERRMAEGQKLPRCVGFIADGNQRWAEERGLSVTEGHRAGARKFKEVAKWVRDASDGNGDPIITHAVFFAFANANWSRPAGEVDGLMELFEEVLREAIKDAAENNIRLRCVGELYRFSRKLRRLMAEAERKTAGNDGPLIVLLLSYDGEQEIWDAARSFNVKLLQSTGDTGPITNEEGRKELRSGFIPNIDMLVRFGKVWRLSGFLPLQSQNAELFFPDLYWPDFSKDDFEKMLVEFGKRDRRFGGRPGKK